MSVFLDQKRFMAAMGQSTTKFDPAQVGLYIRLTLEELCETMVAADPDNADQIKAQFKPLKDNAFCSPNADIVGVYDGVIDTTVTTIGIGVSADLPLIDGWFEVLKTNVAKIDPITGFVTRRPDGKVLKPDGWVGPDLKKILRQHGRI